MRLGSLRTRSLRGHAAAPTRTMGPIRAAFPVLVMVSALALALTACGGGTGSTGDSAEGGGDAAASFPVTIKHKYGETAVEQPPKRVVTAGFNEQDFLLALGVRPVGTRAFEGYAYQDRPWARQQLKGEKIPEVGGFDLEPEKIAALEPDLIIGTYSFLEEPLYDKLAAFAPTIGDLASAEDPGQAPTWEKQLSAIGKATGKSDRASELADDLQAKFAAAKKDAPQLAGKTAAIALYMDDEFYILEPTDLRARFFSDLGLKAPAKTGKVAKENVDQLDQDVLVVVGGKKDELTKDRLFSQLPVVQEDRTVFFENFDSDFAGALGFSSPLSLPYALDVAVPELSAAADGDPATKVNVVE